MGSKILNEKRPLLVNKGLAKLIGLNESIILQQIHYWIKDINQPKGKDSINYQDGYFWTFNTYKEWQEQFSFWSISTIKRTIKNLENRKLIITDNYNKMKIDRTKWYRIHHKNLDELCHYAEVQNDQFSWSEWNDHLSKLNKPITKDYNSEITDREYKNNNNGVQSKKQDSTPHFSFYSDKIQNLLNNYNMSDYIYENVVYYLRKYKQHKGKEHPQLKLDQWNTVFSNITSTGDLDYDREFELIEDRFKAVADQHFVVNYGQEIDHNILHFISGNIMTNRAYEVAY